MGQTSCFKRFAAPRPLSASVWSLLAAKDARRAGADDENVNGLLIGHRESCSSQQGCIHFPAQAARAVPRIARQLQRVGAPEMKLGAEREGARRG